MGLIYKPIGIVLGLLAAQVGKKLFNVVWTKIDDEEPPKPTTEEASWQKLMAVATVQGIIFRITRVAVDRYGAMGWRYLTGTWPGEKRPEPEG
jgi:Na+/H+ antiporter NhaA